MLARTIAITAALVTASTPCLAADLNAFSGQGTRRSSAVVGAYVNVPLGRIGTEHAPKAGLRLAMTHDYRTPTAAEARVIEADALDLRFTGKQPTLYLGGRAVTGEQARLEAGEGGGGRLDKIMLGVGAALVAVAGVVVFTSID